MSEKFDNTLKTLLQDNVEIKSINTGKIIRRGVLQLYSIKDFYITLILKTSKGDTKNYHIPHPYAYKFVNNNLMLDYRLDVIHNDKQPIAEALIDIGESRSPFYDNIIAINRVLQDKVKKIKGKAKSTSR
jgi:hypothetical protein